MVIDWYLFPASIFPNSASHMVSRDVLDLFTPGHVFCVFFAYTSIAFTSTFTHWHFSLSCSSQKSIVVPLPMETSVEGALKLKYLSDVERSVFFVTNISRSLLLEFFTLQLLTMTASLLSSQNASFFQTPASKPNTRIQELPSVISPSKLEHVLLFCIGDSDEMMLWSLHLETHGRSHWGFWNCLFSLTFGHFLKIRNSQIWPLEKV